MQENLISLITSVALLTSVNHERKRISKSKDIEKLQNIKYSCILNHVILLGSMLIPLGEDGYMDSARQLCADRYLFIQNIYLPSFKKSKNHGWLRNHTSICHDINFEMSLQQKYD